MRPAEASPREFLVARLDGLLASAETGRGGVLAVHGAPGVGKTTLLRELAERAGSGWTILRATGHQAERDIARLGVATLLDDHALLDGEGSLVTVGGLVLGRLAELAETRPVLCVIDDGQWLDAASADAIAFAMRRLLDDAVVLVVGQRTDEPSPFDRHDLPTARLHELTLEESAALLAGFGIRHRSVVEECWGRTGGNPLALTELAGSLDARRRAGLEPLDDVIPVAEVIRSAFSSRISALDPDAALALLVLAANDSADVGPAIAALERLGLDRAAFASLEAAGLATIGPGRVEVAHPLVRSVVLADAAPASRRSVHSVLAEVIEDPLRRAHHLAAASIGPDAAVADALEAAASVAFRRTGAAEAARTLEQAAALSTAGADTQRRLLAAGRAWSLCGERQEALRVLAPLERSADLAVSARARGEAADASYWAIASPPAVAKLIDAAHDVTVLEPGLSAELLCRGGALAGLALDVSTACRAADEATAIARDLDPVAQISAGLVHTLAWSVAGRPERAGPTHAVDLVGSIPLRGAPLEVVYGGQLAGFACFLLERWADARRILTATRDESTRTGAATVAAFCAAIGALVDVRTGRWLEARAEATARIDVSDLAPTTDGFFDDAVLALVDGLLGLPGAEQQAELPLRSGRALGLGGLEATALEARGMARLVAADVNGALDDLRALDALLDASGVGEPGLLWYQPALVVAALAAGDRSSAETCRARLARMPGRSQWGTAARAWVEALLAPSAAEAEGPLLETVSVLTALGAPYWTAMARRDLGRCWAELGRVADADQARTEAEAALAALGAPVPTAWASRWADAPVDLAPHPSVAGTAVRVLTPAELRVALAVGQGLSNREAATALYLSPRTVDAHLRSIFTKLGLRSRTELAVLMARVEVAA